MTFHLDSSVEDVNALCQYWDVSPDAGVPGLVSYDYDLRTRSHKL